jgi:hypothetical protein
MTLPMRQVARILRVELTEAEYHALAGAVAVAEAEWDDARGPDRRLAKRRVRSLNAGWCKIRHAWHTKPKGEQ